MTTRKTYLGDGVYVDIDERAPGGIVLTTENGIEVANTIYLEHEVIDHLLDFLKHMTENQRRMSRVTRERNTDDH